MTLRHALTLLVSVFLLSCKKEQAPRIDLGTKSVAVWAGQSKEMPITGGAAGPFTATSSNEEVARVTVTDNRLLITTDMVGEAEITLKNGQQLTTTLKVRADAFAGSWRAMGTTDAYTYRIEVESADAAFSASLKTQLQQKEELPENAVMGYQFRYSGTIFEYRKIFRNGTRLEGNYTFRNLVLTTGTEVFRIIPMDNREFVFEQNLTAQYQALHPDKQITKVVIARYFRMQLMPG